MKLKWIRFFINSVILFLVVNTYSLTNEWTHSVWFKLLSVLLFIGFNLKPVWRKLPNRRLQRLAEGKQLLGIFLATTALSIPYELYFAIENWNRNKYMVISLLGTVVAYETILFWNGIVRVYLRSVQLGIKWRVIGILCGWIPVAHLIALGRILSIVSKEVEVETDKIEQNQKRSDLEICKTKYPILLVHGVFFRDFRFFDYWGRITDVLKKNGAVIFYGNQQSAASVSECGKELAERIQEIKKQTGCQKVNIIAHSKGGLDSRSAISQWGCADDVASLTTINTPHYGCLFADYLLSKIPESICDSVAQKYNAALKLAGDTSPDFMEAVSDLTSEAAKKRNEELKDAEEVYYQSVASKMNVAKSGQFPLNLSYNLVKHFDGANDGLVSVESAKWGEKFTLLEVEKGRGISHGDVIDLNRENIEGFDVREFYVQLVKELKEKGF